MDQNDVHFGSKKADPWRGSHMALGVRRLIGALTGANIANCPSDVLSPLLFPRQNSEFVWSSNVLS